MKQNVDEPVMILSAPNDDCKGSRSFLMLKRHLLRGVSGKLFCAFFLLFTGCKAAHHGDEALQQLYQQAETFTRQQEYPKAVECYNKALALDTLQPASPRVVRALNEKRALEGLSGEYTEAFRSTARLEKLPAAALLADQRSAMFADQARWLRELGRFSEAAASLEKIVILTPELSFELASLYQQSGASWR